MWNTWKDAREFLYLFVYNIALFSVVIRNESMAIAEYTESSNYHKLAIVLYVRIAGLSKIHFMFGLFLIQWIFIIFGTVVVYCCGPCSWLSVVLPLFSLSTVKLVINIIRGTTFHCSSIRLRVPETWDPLNTSISWFDYIFHKIILIGIQGIVCFPLIEWFFILSGLLSVDGWFDYACCL